MSQNTGLRSKPTAIKDVVEFRPEIHGDERGYFFEGFRSSWLEDIGVSVEFVQHNQSRSRKGILRGLHYQLEQPQGKLVRVLTGEVFDVAVDIRTGSPTFGRWVGIYLNAQLGNSLWIPAGFAHGFLTLSVTAELLYQCTDYYHPQSEHSIHWQDPTLAIDWPLAVTEIATSAKDAQGMHLQDAPPFRSCKTKDRASIEA